MVALSRGDRGGADPSMSGERVAQMRQREAERVAEGVGARYYCLNADDAFIQDTPSLRVSLMGVLRQAQADVVITSPPTDYSMDHVTTSKIAVQAALLAPFASVQTDEPPLERAPAVFYMDSITGLDFQPTLYVDITGEFSRKCELLRLHESQMASLPKFGGFDPVSHSEIVGRFRGLQVGVEYAEAFRPAERNPLMRPGVILR
jgi:LmbE family N-acetylglucosaminyl deacetylase